MGVTWQAMPYDTHARHLPSWLNDETHQQLPAEERCRELGSWFIEPREATEAMWTQPYERIVDGSLDVIAALEGSRSVLTLLDGWDDEGAVGYSSATWTRAARFLARHADAALRSLGRPLPRAYLNPADEGSLDLYWDLSDRTLLVNFAHGEDEPASFFGKKSDGDTIQGVAQVDSVRQDLIAWLTL